MSQQGSKAVKDGVQVIQGTPTEPITSATGSPTWWTSSLAIAQCGGFLTSTPGGTQAIGSGASRSRSWPVNTAWTPGNAFASLVSIDVIFACASGERTNAAHSWPVTLMSSM